jgi:hypothetical protein
VSLDRATIALSTAAIVVLGLMFLPELFVPQSALYREALTPRVMLSLGGALKLAFLFLAAVFASRCSASFERGNPVRRAWLLLSVGLWAYVAAQSVLAYYQLVLNVPTPFPSIADLFFVPATLLVAVSLFSFVSVYERVGFRVAEARQLRTVLAFVAALLVVFFLVVARPVIASKAPIAERALNVLYPVLDCLLLVPAILLLRMAIDMRGGRLVEVWMALLLGLLFLAAGDILFAFFTTLGKSALDPLLDLMFAWSYVLIARAAATQYGILSAPPAVG